MFGESPLKPWIRLQYYNFYHEPAFQRRFAIQESIMSTSRRMRKGKAPMSNIDVTSLLSDETQRIAHIRFGLAGVEEYYISFKEMWSIHAKTQFELVVQN
ncbi:hypothetical protein HAX54_002483 [Datura stramonium]|uniref:Uncharacterized protein n=1 Tax=Datura stramonium TaxID=4076 RepID=A0ABS8T3Y2_DATST|nr:hypothetical protein [Datura stramonium]